MSESRKHIDLVKIAYEKISTMIPCSNVVFIECDSSDSSKPTRVIGNFVPDIYYCYGNQLIIGEAKTVEDFDRKHSLQQYESYLFECENYPFDSALVVSVPWQIQLTAKNYFKRWKIRNNGKTEILIINEMGDVQRV